jgi:hypothetical protein
MSGMMSSMMRAGSEEADSYTVYDGSTLLGVLLITRYSALNQSLVSTMFKAASFETAFFIRGRFGRIAGYRPVHQPRMSAT